MLHHRILPGVLILLLCFQFSWAEHTDGFESESNPGGFESESNPGGFETESNPTTSGHSKPYHASESVEASGYTESAGKESEEIESEGKESESSVNMSDIGSGTLNSGTHLDRDVEFGKK